MPVTRRREFLKAGAAALGASTLGPGALALGGPGAAWAEPEGTPRIRRYRKLGRTGLEISDVSFGSSRTADPRNARHALERGINYFDTAESYKDGASEEAIGRALAGRRDDCFLASKVSCGTSDTRADLQRALEGSLRRLQTDHIDVYFNHAVNDVDRLKNDEWHEFATRAKEQGKIRFTGMSGHAGRLVECIDHAVANDLVDVLLVGYNFGQDPAFYERFVSRLDFVAVQPGLPAALARAHAKGVGVIAMKTLRGARLNDMRPYERPGGTFAQAAFRWTLSNPHVDALVVSMNDPDQIDEYVAASGAPAPDGAALDLLEEYVLSEREGYCEHGCSACQGVCPAGVPIEEVLRTRMYATHYGDLEYARRDYAKLGPGAAPCATCTDMPCLGACPGGLPIGHLTRATHPLLARGSIQGPDGAEADRGEAV
jgi:predicted aldo/keto reductase-like oxidoreductase